MVATLNSVPDEDAVERGTVFFNLRELMNRSKNLGGNLF